MTLAVSLGLQNNQSSLIPIHIPHKQLSSTFKSFLYGEDGKYYMIHSNPGLHTDVIITIMDGSYISYSITITSCEIMKIIISVGWDSTHWISSTLDKHLLIMIVLVMHSLCLQTNQKMQCINFLFTSTEM